MSLQIAYAPGPGGASLACTSFGEGPPIVIPATWPWSHFSREWEIAPMREWLEKIAGFARIVRYDCRGTGLSDRDHYDFTLDGQVADLEAVVNHLGLARFALWGGITGGPTALAFAGQQPSRVSHLMLWTSYARAHDLSSPDADTIRAMLATNWRLFTETFAHAAFEWKDAEVSQQYAELMMDGMSQQSAIEGWNEVFRHDATPYLRSITAPTLVMTRGEIPLFTVDMARRMASSIPGARLLVFSGTRTAPFMEDSNAVVETVREFLLSPPADDGPPAGSKLTSRESEVLSLLASGRTSKEIATSLGISAPTVQRHIANIYAKIGARGRVDAVAYAFEHGLVDRSERP